MNERLRKLEEKSPLFLYAPTTFWKAPLQVIKIATGGCGAGRIGDYLVPDRMYGLSIFHACRIHDWMYRAGVIIEDKYEADRVFLNNMLRLIDKEQGGRFLKWLRRRRAFKYYKAVETFGGPAFWKDKEDSPNSQLQRRDHDQKSF